MSSEDIQHTWSLQKSKYVFCIMATYSYVSYGLESSDNSVGCTSKSENGIWRRSLVVLLYRKDIDVSDFMILQKKRMDGSTSMIIIISDFPHRSPEWFQKPRRLHCCCCQWWWPWWRFPQLLRPSPGRWHSAWENWGVEFLGAMVGTLEI